MFDSLLRNLLLVSQLLSAKADNHVSKNKDDSLMYKGRKCYQDKNHCNQDHGYSIDCCTEIAYLWTNIGGDLCHNGYDIVFPGVGCETKSFGKLEPNYGASFYCCEPIDCIEDKDKCTTEKCCSPYSLPTDGPFVGCQDGYDLQWVTGLDSHTSYCGPNSSYWNAPYKCCKGPTTTTTKAPTTTTTKAPTTKAPTTKAPTTEAPATEAPTTKAPTTEAPTTKAPTTPTTTTPTTTTPTTTTTRRKCYKNKSVCTDGDQDCCASKPHWWECGAYDQDTFYEPVWEGKSCTDPEGDVYQYETDGGSFMCCEPVKTDSMVSDDSKCTNDNCCAPPPWNGGNDTDYLNASCKDGFILQWQYNSTTCGSNNSYDFGGHYKCWSTTSTTTTTTISPVKLAFGYYDCNYILPSLQNMDQCGLPIKMENAMYTPCHDLNHGGSMCRKHCDLEEQCEFYSVTRTGSGNCNCTLKTWNGVKGAMDVSPDTIQQHSEGLKHCDLSIFVHSDLFSKKCSKEKTCVYALTNGMTWGMSDAAWAKVRGYNTCWQTEVY